MVLVCCPRVHLFPFQHRVHSLLLRHCSGHSLSRGSASGPPPTKFPVSLRRGVGNPLLVENLG